MKKNTVLVIDGGGRGSVLVDKYAQSKFVGKILAVPGSDLMKIYSSKPVEIFPKIKTTEIDKILKICKKEKVSLVDVAQDNAVEAGLVDSLIKNKIPVIGPTKKAGQIEWDKIWARNFMKKYKIPHPEFKVCLKSPEGIKFIKSQKNKKWVIKASGLTEGKGVYVCEDRKEALDAILKMKSYKDAGRAFLIEKFLKGEEFSSYAISDGKNFKLIGHAQDHKQVFDNDKGDNTGGMGAVSPVLVVNKNIEKQIDKIFDKIFNGLRFEKRPYTGILYLGGIVVDGKVYVIEFNARWGDPEAQVVVPSLKNDLFELSLSVARKNINKLKIKTDGKTRVAVVGASKGYPKNYSKAKNKEISGFKNAEKILGVKIYGAAVKFKNNKYYTNGGRLFYIVGEGRDVNEARKKAYQAMSRIKVEGNNLHYRTDIGWRDVERFRTAK